MDREPDVVLGALLRGGRAFLVRRNPAKRANPDIWDLPGGCVEHGESELEALSRELHEELGVHIDSSSAAHLYRLTTGPSDAPAIASAWAIRDWRGEPHNCAPEEHTDVGWFEIDALPTPARPQMRAAFLAGMRALDS